jgi:hypothetical protein
MEKLCHSGVGLNPMVQEWIPSQAGNDGVIHAFKHDYLLATSIQVLCIEIAEAEIF